MLKLPEHTASSTTWVASPSELMHRSGMNRLESSSPRSEPFRGVTRPPAPHWSAWVDRLERAPHVARDERLALSLDIEACLLTLATQRRIKSGDWGRPVRLAQNRMLNAAAMAADDAAMLDAVETIPWADSGSLRLTGRVGARAIATALDSGRLQTPQGDILQSGEARVGQLGWRFDGTHQHPTVEVEGATLWLPLTPLHYWDASRGTLGVVTVPGVEPRVASEWHRGPPVSSQGAAALGELLARTRPQLPRPVEIEQVGGSPVARITLRELHAKLPYAEPQRVAELSFRYGDAKVSGYARGDETVELSPTRRAIVRRDHDKESLLRYALCAHGFDELEPDFASPWDRQVERWNLPSVQDWLAFLLDGHRELADLGFEIDIDPSFSLRIVESDDWFTDLEPSERDWFNLELGIVVDGERVSLLPALLAALRDRADLEHAMFLPLPGGGYVTVPRERIAPLVDLLLELAAEPEGKGRRLSRLRAMDLAAVVRSERGALAAMRALRDELTSGDIAPPTLPKAFRAELRPYQRAGTGWLWKLHRAGLGAVLADDMGLGKTVQVIAILCILRQKKDRLPSLVVAPTSVLISWVDQLAAFAPHLDVVLWHGAARGAERSRIASADVVLTSYGLLHRDAEDLTGRAWDLCVLDEAQTIKNAKTVFWEHARSLDARQRVAITGTPVENHLGELWSIVSFAIPGALGSERGFRAVYRTPIEKRRDEACLASLRRRLAPVLLRRTKEQVASELPDKTVIEHSIELTDAQRDIYEAVRQTTVKAVRDAIAARGFARSQIIVLDALLKLRQICCDPRLLKSKVAKRATRSAKLDAFSELVTTLVAEGRRILVFSQFVEMLDLIAARLDEEGVAFLTLTGATTNRRAVVDMFRKGTVPVFLISLKAGGTGLNLVEADTVIHYDPWWNPAVEAQATDRVHRIGQTRPVFVHKLVTRSTVEQKIVELQRSKAELARGLFEGGFDAPLLDEATVDALLAPMPR